MEVLNAGFVNCAPKRIMAAAKSLSFIGERTLKQQKLDHSVLPLLLRPACSPAGAGRREDSESVWIRSPLRVLGAARCSHGSCRQRLRSSTALALFTGSCPILHQVAEHRERGLLHRRAAAELQTSPSLRQTQEPGGEQRSEG
ncbi:unnamed protein product [Pleuronectes platessa]|uniref:Uncharacterized protein n=1 Tax=Pleuronectes platessa TaxID=8262 RepID=A0A9N7Z6K3_PLEPL|nr:unnamed protein product [Pleuronectes platessa]